MSYEFEVPSVEDVASVSPPEGARPARGDALSVLFFEVDDDREEPIPPTEPDPSVPQSERRPMSSPRPWY